MMRKITIDGNFAASNIAYMFNEVAMIYPITPSSPMAENIDIWSNDNKQNIFGNIVKVAQMQSEAGVAGAVHGSLIAGSKTTVLKKLWKKWAEGSVFVSLRPNFFHYFRTSFIRALPLRLGAPP